MSEEILKNQILEAWREHAGAVRASTGESGPLLNTVDLSRENAIEVVKIIMFNFLKGDFDIQEFKTALDSYNKHNNLWGYTTKLGQMYFNQLIKACENQPAKLTSLLKDIITEPKNIKEAVSRIDTLETFTMSIYNKAKDKHSAPYPGAAGYFLSYFWQIANYQKWPVLYNTLVNAFRELNLWEEQKTQKDTYSLYYSVYNSIKKVVEEDENRKVGYWELEHAFWNYKAKPLPVAEPIAPLMTETAAAVESEAPVVTSTPEVIPTPEVTPTAPLEVVSPEKLETVVTDTPVQPVSESVQPVQSPDIREYIIPRLHRLLDAPSDGGAGSGENTYEKLVAEAFAQMGFELEECNQHAGKNAFAILRFREENIAYILDASASSEAFYSHNDRRLVKEYINDACSALRREGYKRCAYVLVCNAFTEEQKTLASFIDWNTEVRKTYLMDTTALLYLLAFKQQKRLSLYRLLERMSLMPHYLDSRNIVSELASGV